MQLVEVGLFDEETTIETKVVWFDREEIIHIWASPVFQFE
jgi:hypothetical protein